MNQSETIIACGGHVCERIGMKLAIFRGPSIDDPTKFRFIWPSGFRGDFYKLANQKQELPVVAMFGNGS